MHDDETESDLETVDLETPEGFCEFVRAAFGLRLDLARRDFAVDVGPRRPRSAGGPSVVAVPWIWNDPETTLCSVYLFGEDLADGEDDPELVVVRKTFRVRHARLRRFDCH